MAQIKSEIGYKLALKVASHYANHPPIPHSVQDQHNQKVLAMIESYEDTYLSIVLTQEYLEIKNLISREIHTA
jgi:hypothetical protein